MRLQLQLLPLVLFAVAIGLPPAHAEFNLRRNTEESGRTPYVAGDLLSTMIDQSAESAVVPEVNENGARKRYEIMFRQDASYTTVHFADFDFHPGCSMGVSGKALGDGSRQFYKLAGRGKMDAGTFWSQHVKGDTMFLEIHCDASLDAVTDAYFVIDEVAVGFVDEASAQEAQEETELFGESTCGIADFENAKCYPSSSPEYTTARAVARLMINGVSYCTGWLASGANHLVTNEHCITSSSDALNTDYEFGAEAPTCTTFNCQGCHPSLDSISGATFIKANANLDYALVQITNIVTFNPQARYGFLVIDDRDGIRNELIYIPQHPAGRAKEIAAESTHAMDSGFCRLNSITETGCGNTGGDYGCTYCLLAVVAI